MKKKLLLLCTVILIFTSCHSKSDKQYFDSAYEKAKAKNYTEAVKEYDLLAGEFPNSDYTCKGLLEAGKIYHSILIPATVKADTLKSFMIAIRYYKRILKDFSEKPEAESALFMMGFIQANEINQLDSARISYMTFLKKYPGSPMISSVNLELNNLGKTPDQILQVTARKPD
jgi:outer membrane protein assembly factor BamD (BamD/ComL family)